MTWYKNRKISTKLIIGFVVIAIIAGVVGLVGFKNINSIEALDDQMYLEQTLPMSDLGDMGEKYQRIRVNLFELLNSEDSNTIKDTLAGIDQKNKDFMNDLDIFERSMNTDSLKDEIGILKDLYLNKFTPYRDQAIQLITSGQKDQAVELMMSDGDKINEEIQSAIDNLFTEKEKLAKSDADINKSTAKNAETEMIVIILIAMIAAVASGIFVSRIISRPVSKMVEAANKLALGDIDVSVDVNCRDEIGSLSEAFNKMILNIRDQAHAAERIAAGDLTVQVAVKSENDLLGKKLSELVYNNNNILAGIASASDQVAEGSKQISDSSMALSEGATEQASSIQELTASLEEISAQTQENAKNANQANELAENAKLNAVQGNTQMKEMLRAMEEINESSANISKIIKVIDDIAFQTNILALNAAVEAARAGQHGKGFAVVAEEVRNLAARSANAAKETTDMIEGSIRKAEGGTKIAKDTAEALNKIVNEIEKVAVLINDIAISSNEQSVGIGQINQGIMQVSQVVQTNSATSEEGAAASEELSSQAELLKQMVSKYKLRQNKKSVNKLEEISPEILRMLESLAQKKQNSAVPGKEVNTVPDQKIILSDKDFGKY